MKHQALFHGDLVNTTRIIYTPSEFAKTSLLHVQEIGTLQAQKPHVSKREDLDSYLFFMVRSGSGELHYAHNTYPLGVGDCVFIDCRSAYFHETKDDLWSLSWVHFNGPSIDGIYQKYKERGGLPAFHANAFSLYEDCFNHLYSIVSGNSYVRDMQINEGLSALLTLLMEDSWHPDSMPAHTKRTSLWHVREYLDQNYAQKISLDDLAERYFINKYYLTRIFKEQFGVTINNYLLNIRITHAKRELRFSGQSAEEIGAEVGFHELYYFSRVFKKVEGCSISEYRRMWGT